MNLSIEEVKNRVKRARDRFELLRLREEISALIESPEFQQVPRDDRNRVEDLLVEVIAKEEQYKGCDPMRNVFGH